MIVLRSIESTDLAAFMGLASEVGPGMTTLKADEAALAKRIQIACASFDGKTAPVQADYVFMLEDTEAAKVVGVCALKAAVGLDQPFYNFRLGRLVHSSTELGIYHCKETLYLSNDLTGMAELCSLYLNPAYRNGSNGKLLSKSRFLFMAQFVDLFPEVVIAEMRGFQRSDGTSPFWESLGRHFFKMDFARADNLVGLGKKFFIAELMPKYPVYVDYLSEEARGVIGKVHADTAPAMRLLEQEGLHYEGYVDIFDAGPVMQGRVKQLRAIRESQLAIARRREAANGNSGAVRVVVSNTKSAGFRALVTEGNVRFGNFGLSEQELEALQIKLGDPVRVMALSPGDRLHG